ncbi:MAG: hypothetical protein WA939_19905 [Nodosilinea sp.]
MRTLFLKASVMVVGAVLLATVTTGCQEYGAIASSDNPSALGQTQPTPPANKAVNGSTDTTLTDSQSIAPSYSSEQQFDLVNGTSLAMINFYAEPSEVAGWGDDQLGDLTLMPNDFITININDNRQSCTYDFNAVFEDGSQVEADGINICELSSYTFTELDPASQNLPKS